MRKERTLQLRVSGSFMGDLKSLTDLVNDSHLRAQALARGIPPVNCADLVNLALLAAYDVGDRRALAKIGAGFDRAEDAIRRITFETGRRSLQDRRRREALRLIQGGAS